MNIIAVVVLFNPDEGFLDRCLLISSQINNLIVYDNSTDEDIIKHNQHEISKISNVIFYSKGENNGIGAALNYAVSVAKELNADFLFTFDQDTQIPNNYVSRMLQSFQREENIGVLGPIYKDINVDRECKFPVKWNGLILRKNLSDKNKIQDVMTVITSGALYPMQIFDDVGIFEDDYFIDYIDNEFCLRVLKNGYRVCVEPGVVINHALGNRTINKILLNFSPTNYPFYRKYYITRNRLFVYKKYFFKFPAFILYDLAAFSLDFFRVISFEKNKWIKIKAYSKAIKDFILNKKGAMIQ